MKYLARESPARYITEMRCPHGGTPAKTAICRRAVFQADSGGIHRGRAGYRQWYVTTLADEQGRKTVAELVSGCGVRVWPVGRLDLDSEGLLILTNDGALTHRLIHPSHEVDKQYLVMVAGDVEAALPILSRPMELDGIALAPAKVDRLGPNVLSVTIHEGRNRQVRRMCDQAGLTVKALRRVREGGVQLGGLKLGQWRHLTEEEISALYSL